MKVIRIILILLVIGLFSIPISPVKADYIDLYWVNNGGNLSDYPPHIALSSGGVASYDNIPYTDGYVDFSHVDMHFDANSFTLDSQTADFPANLNSLDCTGVTHNPNIDFNGEIYGNVTLSADMTFSGAFLEATGLDEYGQPNHYINSNGCVIGTLVINGEYSCDSLNVGELEINNNCYIAGAYVQVGSISILPDAGNTVDVRYSTFVISNGHYDMHNYAVDPYFQIGGALGINLLCTESSVVFPGNPHAPSFYLLGSSSYQLVINGMDFDATNGATADINCDYLTLSNSDATGDVLWYPGTHSINGGNTTGWIWPILNDAEVTTELPSNSTGLTMQLNGSLYLRDWPEAYCSIDFGEDESYGQTLNIGTLTEDSEFSAIITGLSIGTRYHYQAYAEYDGTTIYGEDLEFTNSKANLPPYTGGGGGSGVLDDLPLMPPQMYTELDTSKIPGGEIVDDILAESDTPPALWWFPFIFCIIGIVALLIYGLTVKTGGEGSLLLMCIVIEAGLVLFGVMGVTSTSSIIPLFPMFLFLIPAVAIIFSRKHYGWG